MEEAAQQQKDAAIAIKLPLGKSLEVSGSNLTLNTLMTLAILGIMSWVGAWVYFHKSDMETGRAETNRILLKYDETQNKMISAVKENTCILSLPQEKREAEFNAPNSLCKRMIQ